MTRLEAGASGGRLVFDDNPNIDPEILIGLIQKSPQEFGFDGRNTLRFKSDLDEAEDRIEYIVALLRKFSPEKTA